MSNKVNYVNIDLGSVVTSLLSVAIYLGLGLGVYMLLGTFGVFVWADPMVYVYMLLWPFILIWTFLKWAFIAAILVGIVFLGVRLAR